MLRDFRFEWLLLSFTGLMVACGGGGGDKPAPPTVNLTSSVASAEYGATTKLTWTSTAATSCMASGAWSGAHAASGEETSAKLTGPSTFTLTCENAGGPASSIVNVVAPALVADPGEAGNTSLAGMDSNQNQVRDDIERYILTSTEPGGTREALIERSKILQELITQTPTPEMSEHLLRNFECLVAQAGDEAFETSAQLDATFLNTKERAFAYIDFSSASGVQELTLSDPANYAESCARQGG